MIPGMNAKQMRQAMKKMGVRQEDYDASLVVIHMADKEILIHNPSVSKVHMMGQESWQITGQVEERAKSTAPTINDDDVAVVMEKAGVSEEKAREALEAAEGDLASAILSFEN